MKLYSKIAINSYFVFSMYKGMSCYFFSIESGDLMTMDKATLSVIKIQFMILFVSWAECRSSLLQHQPTNFISSFDISTTVPYEL
jgi:hypothetical protein